MSAQLIDGRGIAGQIRTEVRAEVDRWTAQGHRPPYLAVVLVGDNPASASYVRGKIRASQEAGIMGDTLAFGADVPESELLETVSRLGRDKSVDGILVQLPLPAHIRPDRIIGAVNPDKDVDGLNTINAGRLVTGRAGFLPCTPAGIVELLTRSDIPTCGQHTVILGRSNLVGKPLANLMLRKGLDATVTICHSRTRNLKALARSADIVVAAIGRACFVTEDMVKPGAAVIDVGINRVEDPSRTRGYRLAGDVDFEAVRHKAAHLTPVPGGVGPMTIAMLLKNTLLAAQRHTGL
ncbi:MAG: bifunctional methylenetetrahydrofolate dehydrogenase/methenyltetrahydrofolate cyclohydrolase FolD [Bacteroidota bacterium]|nr:bifunctional methylenetetrahydrofolate dehydrogenase/methenyltetrahydrofolate cyclohydrolase FolD [Bacteroidota bacterium]